MGAGDITFSPNLVPDAGYKWIDGINGEAILAGQWLYKNESDGKLYKAQGDTLTKSKVVGLALGSQPAANQPMKVLYEGRLTGLTGLTKRMYFLSDTTSGAAMPAADFGTGDYVTSLGAADSTTSFKVKINITEVQHA